jgi:hypothetical protein
VIGRGEASCELQVTSYGLRVTGCELRVASCELQVTGCELRVGWALLARVNRTQRFCLHSKGSDDPNASEPPVRERFFPDRVPSESGLLVGPDERS